MKIKVTDKSYEEVLALPKAAHKRPMRQLKVWRSLIATLSKKELKDIDFTYEEDGMEKLGKKEPALILMNHSSFTDLQIVGTIFKNRPYNIVCTNDGFVGKEGLMRAIGCIPTRKFVPEATLVKDMNYVLHTLKSSVVMFPEASYSFDGTETPLPGSLGKCVKLLKVPVIMVKTEGAFLRDPLYNNLQKRKVKVSARVTYLISPKDAEAKSADEINDILADAFRYDHWKAQYAHGVPITEDFRADGLHRVLYKCPKCGKEGHMLGKGISVKCGDCGDEHELLPDGSLKNKNEGDTRFRFVSDWYRWERECVRSELESDEYRLDTDVDILILKDMNSMYRVGSGHLTHTRNGFTLTGCDGALEYSQSASASYSLYADYFWYEIGDVISIGDKNLQYYCFPKDKTVNVAKARLAAEEAYKLHK
ncbi:MAG: 1-acyl-sn-glycerol-3-phosphate acyltransferase [Lachnospiraceae bacterium]|nr:1-acyl-sn-glycerol-3-phosphate acyltransferase [Lachnospiraceae bacterium]